MLVGILHNWAKHQLRMPIEFVSSPYPCQGQPSLGFHHSRLTPFWADLEKKFHTYFYTGTGEKKIIDLTTIRQKTNESSTEFLRDSERLGTYASH